MKMPRPATLPPAFGSLCHGLQYVQHVSDIEYSAECPECGGIVHPNNEFPDRFRLFLDGHPRAWCRRCGYFVWADQVDKDASPPTPQALDQWRKEQVAREEARKRSAELALTNLRKRETWRIYYDQLGPMGRAYWAKRGISWAWQDWWRLGWQPESRWGVPTATIPIFGYQWEAQNIKHRLIGVTEVGGKYRYELYGQQQALFLCNPEKPLGGHVIVVEGEIKAAVTFATLDDSKVNMVGLPGATPGQHIVEQFAECDKITLVLDPGAEKHARQLAKQLGKKRCRVLTPPMKIDDGILAAQMTGQDVRRLLNQAVPT